MEYIHIKDNEIKLISDAKIDNGQYDKIIELSIPQGKEVYIEKGEAKLRDIDYSIFEKLQLSENKEQATSNIKGFATQARSQLVGTSDIFKLTEYADKAALAPKILDGSASKEAMASAEDEAKLLGLKDAKALGQIWQKKADGLRSARLQVTKMEKAAIAAIEKAKNQAELDKQLSNFKSKAGKALKALLGG